ncbi:MAG: hypothetical protein RL220_156 [Bacteroidota bacterium]
MGILDQFRKAHSSGAKWLAVLIDPDIMSDRQRLDHTLDAISKSRVDLILVGGSLLLTDHFNSCVRDVKSRVKQPVVIFPGSAQQVSPDADAILFLSLISGRNPELLIGQHVMAAPAIREHNLEAIPTGYMLIDGGKPTTASYISGTLPIPHDKPGIAAATAMAGEMLGLGCIYLDTGSGAELSVSPQMIRSVRKAVNTPLMVGGGIRNAETAEDAWSAGADIVVIGTAFEENPDLLPALSWSAVRTA